MYTELMWKKFCFGLISVFFASIIESGIASAQMALAYRPTNEYLFTAEYTWNFSLFIFGLVLLVISVLLLFTRNQLSFIGTRGFISYLNPFYFVVTLLNFLIPFLDGLGETTVPIGRGFFGSPSPYSYTSTTSDFPWFLIDLNSTWNLVLGGLLIFLCFLLRRKGSNRLEQA